MKKKISSKDNLNLFISAFLIIAYIVCAYFFMGYAKTQTDALQLLVTNLIFVAFGAILFYATRVGDGVPVKRFSVITLVTMVIPSFYVILATIIPQLPFNSFFVNNEIIYYMAAIALGYGVPYTFLSGYELVVEEEIVEEMPETEDAPLDGGLEQEIQENQDNETQETEEETEEEVVVEGVEPAEDENTEEE